MKAQRVIALIMTVVMCASCAGCGTTKAEYTTDKSLSVAFSNNKSLHFGESQADIEKDFGKGTAAEVGTEYDIGKNTLTVNYRNSKAIYISTSSGDDGKSGLGVSIGDMPEQVSKNLGNPIHSDSFGEEYIFVKGEGTALSPFSESYTDYKKSIESFPDEKLEQYVDVTIQSYNGKVVNITYMDCLFAMKNK